MLSKSPSTAFVTCWECPPGKLVRGPGFRAEGDRALPCSRVNGLSEMSVQIELDARPRTRADNRRDPCLVAEGR